MTVRALGYFGIGASDLPAWREFATQILGLELGSESGEGLRLRVDDEEWRIAIEPGTEDDLPFAGFEVEDDAALDSLASRLAVSGFAATEDSALAARRGVERLLVTRDPDGIACELFHGRKPSAAAPFKSPIGVGGFVTEGRGVGHLVLAVANIDASRRFYEDLLGFSYSDAIDMQLGPVSVRAIFLHCNARHHSLALVPVAVPKRLHHFMLQLRELDDVGTCLDRVKSAGIPIKSTFGKHSNDHMLSFYMQTPSGFEVEYGYGAREIDDAVWEPQLYDRGSLWGHDRSQSA